MAELGLIGRTPAMLALYSWIWRVSKASNLPVLITGETGTGKELVARAIHRLDPKRRVGSLIPVNCIALSSGVAGSELFGHRRGSFTGAAEDHRGFFRAADRGVLFLDEIADLDLVLQGKLLRVLQEGKVQPVGSDRELAVDVRVIAATNKDLAALIADGRFRLDLFHRLAVLETRLPSLSERCEDVPLLIGHFVKKHASRQEEPPSISRAFANAIAGSMLPGNVRQLENLIRRALVEHPGPVLGIEALPTEPTSVRRHPLGTALPNTADVHQRERGSRESDHAWSELLAVADFNLAAAMAICESKLLQAALVSAHGNQSLAASRLGVTPRSIYNMVRRHGLVRARATNRAAVARVERTT